MRLSHVLLALAALLATVSSTRKRRHSSSSDSSSSDSSSSDSSSSDTSSSDRTTDSSSDTSTANDHGFKESAFAPKFAAVQNAITMPPRTGGTKRNHSGTLAVPNARDRDARPVLTGVVGTGWMRFTFGRVGATASRSWAVYSPTRPVVVRLVDLYCPGDVLELVAGRAGAGPLKRIAVSSYASPDGCAMATPDEEVALAGGIWSALQVTLPPGRHVLSVRVVASPYGSGEAAIRFDAEGPREKNSALSPAYDGAYSTTYGERRRSMDDWAALAPGDTLLRAGGRLARDDSSSSSSWSSDSSTSEAAARGPKTLFPALAAPKAVCNGYEGYFVANSVRAEHTADRAADMCAAYNGVPAGTAIPAAGSTAHTALVRTLTRCVLKPRQSVAVDAPGDDGTVPGLRYSLSTSDVVPAMLRSSDAAPVLCRK